MNVEEEFTASPFAWRSVKDTSATQIADAACTTWREINIALAPIIGQKGVVALVKRSLHLQHPNYPALKAIHGSRILPGEFPALHAVLSQQTTRDAILINTALLNIFYELLIKLIGAPLTHQLLHSILAPPSNGYPVQDTLS
jgi:hypothetical protein